MKRLYLFLGTLSLLLTGFIVLCCIGIPSRLSDKNIDPKTLADIKEVTAILIQYRNEIRSKDSVSQREFMPDGYSYINQMMVDTFFRSLPDAQKAKIKALFQRKEIYEIDMGRMDCIRFHVKASGYNEFYTSNWEVIDLVYDESPKCDCNTVEGDDNKILNIENMGNHWYKVDKITRPSHFHS